MSNIVSIPAGDVAYSKEEAAVYIDDVIKMLEEAKADGAERVVLESGNYRGAQYRHFLIEWEWIDD